MLVEQMDLRPSFLVRQTHLHRHLAIVIGFFLSEKQIRGKQ